MRWFTGLMLENDSEGDRKEEKYWTFANMEQDTNESNMYGRMD